MNQKANDAISLLISRHVEPCTLGKILRADRDEVATWALALAPVPDDLEEPVLALHAYAVAGTPIPYQALAWELDGLSQNAWARAIADWPTTIRLFIGETVDGVG